VNRFGGLLYREYFRDYPRKVWGLSPEKIHRSVAEKRVPAMTLAELVQSVLGVRPPVRHPEYAAKNYYLPQGIGEIAKFFEAELRRHGARILLGATVERIDSEGKLASSIRLRHPDGETEEIASTALLSTVPLPDFVSLFPAAHAGAKEAASALEYRSTVLLFLLLGEDGGPPCPIVYFTDGGTLFSRLYDVGQFSKAMVPERKSLLCLEFPCRKGDDVWARDTADLCAHAEEVLVARGIIRPGLIEESFSEKVAHSYPVFDAEYDANLERCFAFVHGHDNVLSFGRQGGFRYLNTDGVTREGFRAAAAVMMAPGLDTSLAEWFRLH
jgi:protoporphyrinogen oxidase